MLTTLYIVTSYLYGLISGLALVALMKNNQSHASNKKKWLVYFSAALSLILLLGILGEINTRARPDDLLLFISILIAFAGFLCGLIFKKYITKLLL